MAKYKKLSEQDISTLVDANIKQAVGYFDSKLSTERQRVMEHYTAKLPFLTMTETQNLSAKMSTMQ